MNSKESEKERGVKNAWKGKQAGRWITKQQIWCHVSWYEDQRAHDGSIWWQWNDLLWLLLLFFLLHSVFIYYPNDSYWHTIIRKTAGEECWWCSLNPFANHLSDHHLLFLWIILLVVTPFPFIFYYCFLLYHSSGWCCRWWYPFISSDSFILPFNHLSHFETDTDWFHSFLHFSLFLADHHFVNQHDLS